jgi:hypothetical protein
MVPPANYEGKPIVDAPLSEWHHIHAFDTARECEDFKTGAIDYGGQKREGKGVMQLISESRCVPSEHLYPTKKPVK